MNLKESNANSIKNLIILLEPRILFDGAIAPVQDAIFDLHPAENTGPVQTSGDISTFDARNTEPADIASEETGQGYGDQLIAGLAQQEAYKQVNRNEIVVVDTNIVGYSSIVDHIGDRAGIILISGTDGMMKLGNALKGLSDIDGIHILSHGSEGAFTLGKDEVNMESLPEYTQSLDIIKNVLSDDGDMYLYGCSVAAGEGGMFLNELSRITGADVAGSDDATGNRLFNGDWELEKNVGTITDSALFDTHMIQDFNGVLPSPPTVIVDVNETPPADPSSVLYTVVGGSDYSIVNVVGNGEFFKIDPDDGEIRLTAAGSKAYGGLDYEDRQEHILTVNFTSSGSLIEQVVTFKIKDINPKPVDEQTFTVSEAASAGDSIGILQHTGDDDSLTITRADSLTSIFNINGDTSEITVKNPALLDYETQQNHTGPYWVSTVTNVNGTNEETIVLVTINFNITNVDEEPELTATGQVRTFTEGGSSVSLFSNAAIDTIEPGQKITSFAATVSNVSDDGSREFIYVDEVQVALSNGNSGTTTNSFTYSVSLSGGTATLTVGKNVGTVEEFQDLINNLAYKNDLPDVDANNRVVTITSLIDSGDNTGNNNNTNNTLTLASTVSMINVNDEPSLTATKADPTFTEDGAAVKVFTGTAVDTVEAGQTIKAITLTVTHVSDTTETLNIDGTNIDLIHGGSGTTVNTSIDYTVNAAAGTVTITLSKTCLTTLQTQTLVDGITYKNSSDNPSTANTRVITITSLTDSGGTALSGDDTASLSVSSSVLVAAVNDAPDNSPTSDTLTEDSIVSGNVTGTTNLLAGSDVDDPDADLTISQVNGSSGNLGNAVTVTLSYTDTNCSSATIAVNVTVNEDGSFSVAKKDLNAIPEGNTATGTLTYKVKDDSGAESGNKTFTLKVTGQNDAPNSAGSTDTLTEDSIVSGNVTGTTNLLAGSDVDDPDADLTISQVNGSSGNLGNAVTVTLSYTDKSGSLATINVGVTVNTDGSFSVTQKDINAVPAGVTAQGTLTYRAKDDSGAESGDKTFTLKVTGQNEAPNSAGSTDTLTEDSIVSGNVNGSTNLLAGSGVDDPDADLTISQVNGSSGNLGNAVTVSLSYTDKSGSLATINVGVTANADGSFSVAQKDINAVPSGVTAEGTLTYRVKDDSDSESGDKTFTLKVTGQNDDPTLIGLLTDIAVTEETAGNVGLSAVTLADVDSASITLTISADTGTLIVADGGSVGAGVAEAGSGTQTITLAGSPANINTYLDTSANIQYTGASNVDGDNAALLTVTANDGDGSGDLALGTINMNITNTSDDPDGADKTISIQTSTAHTFSAADFGFSDPDTNDALNRVQIKLQTIDNGELELNSNTVNDGDWITLADIPTLVYTPSGAGSDNFTFTVEDNSASTATDSTSNTMTITSSAPVVTPNPNSNPNPEPEPDTKTESFDGVIVETRTVENEDGTTTKTMTVEPVTTTRVEESGTPNTELADIPLQYGDTDKSTILTKIGLPVGVGLVVTGNNTPQTTDGALNELIALTNSTVSDSNGNGNMLNGAQAFLDTIAGNNGELVVNSIVFNLAEGVSQVPQTIVIAASPGNDGKMNQALVIDASNLPPGTQLDLIDVEFAIVIGPVTLRGGAGANIVFAGSGSQNIILGEDDDELHGGDGDDTIGSEGGDDLLFGDNGNDTLFGGEGTDTLHGGADTDTAIYNGNQNEYTIEQHFGEVIIISNSDTNDKDRLINIESLSFTDGTLPVNYNTDLSSIATLYNNILDRQADLDGFQHWAGRLDTGMSPGQLAMGFYNSTEYQMLTGTVFEDLSVDDQVETFYNTMLSRSSDSGGKEYWLDVISNGVSLAGVAEGFIQSQEMSGISLQSTDWDFFL